LTARKTRAIRAGNEESGVASGRRMHDQRMLHERGVGKSAANFIGTGKKEKGEKVISKKR